MGAFSNTIQGIEGSIILGLGHGLVSSGMFIVAGGVLYMTELGLDPFIFI